jgi:CelD/BcsL family acetyltransferase involved in cellulose biosynthesis
MGTWRMMKRTWTQSPLQHYDWTIHRLVEAEESTIRIRIRVGYGSTSRVEGPMSKNYT